MSHNRSHDKTVAHLPHSMHLHQRREHTANPSTKRRPIQLLLKLFTGLILSLLKGCVLRSVNSGTTVRHTAAGRQRPGQPRRIFHAAAIGKHVIGCLQTVGQYRCVLHRNTLEKHCICMLHRPGNHSRTLRHVMAPSKHHLCIFQRRRKYRSAVLQVLTVTEHTLSRLNALRNHRYRLDVRSVKHTERAVDSFRDLDLMTIRFLTDIPQNLETRFIRINARRWFHHLQLKLRRVILEITQKTFVVTQIGPFHRLVDPLGSLSLRRFLIRPDIFFNCRIQMIRSDRSGYIRSDRFICHIDITSLSYSHLPDKINPEETCPSGFIIS